MAFAKQNTSEQEATPNPHRSVCHGVVSNVCVRLNSRQTSREGMETCVSNNCQSSLRAERHSTSNQPKQCPYRTARHSVGILKKIKAEVKPTLLSRHSCKIQ